MNGLVSHGKHFVSTQCEIRSCWRFWWQFRLQCIGGDGNKLLDLKVELIEVADGLRINMTEAKTSPHVFLPEW